MGRTGDCLILLPPCICLKIILGLHKYLLKTLTEGKATDESNLEWMNGSQKKLPVPSVQLFQTKFPTSDAAFHFYSLWSDPGLPAFAQDVYFDP